MSNICKCGLEFGAPATLRIHENKCEFKKPLEEDTKPKKQGRPAKK